MRIPGTKCSCWERVCYTPYRIDAHTGVREQVTLKGLVFRVVLDVRPLIVGVDE